MIISAIEIFITGRLQWKKNIIDIQLVVLMIATAISTFLITPNHVQALINPYFSLFTLFALAVFYIQALKSDTYQTIIIPLLAASVVSGLLTLIMYLFNPFQSLNLPFALQFLKSSSFSAVGTPIDLAVFMGFCIILTLNLLFGRAKNNIFYLLILLLNIAALITTGYFIFKNQLLISLPPVRLSWFAAIETLKNPVTAFFGAGIDNFSVMFTQIKDLAYNQSPQWQITSFMVSRSTLLHILTETGLVGFAATILIMFNGLKAYFSGEKNGLIAPFIYMIVVFIMLPPSFINFFLFFVALSFIPIPDTVGKPTINIRWAPILAVVMVGFALFSLYFFGQKYLADFYMRKSTEGMVKNDLRELYDGQRMAIKLNPSMESYHIAFSQTNAFLARNVANKNTQPNASISGQLSDKDKQLVTQTIQAAIAEAKFAVALNPRKAIYWDNLASIYKSIINVAQEADAWTISAYQRAIELDPNNPTYRLSLGGVYFSLGNYDDAQILFKQAVALKPNWSNAHYNLAWTAYYKKDYQSAISEMSQVLTLTDPDKNKGDYEKAQKELTQFKTDSANVAGASTMRIISPTPSAAPQGFPSPTP